MCLALPYTRLKVANIQIGTVILVQGFAVLGGSPVAPFKVLHPTFATPGGWGVNPYTSIRLRHQLSKGYKKLPAGAYPAGSGGNEKRPCRSISGRG